MDGFSSCHIGLIPAVIPLSLPFPVCICPYLIKEKRKKYPQKYYLQKKRKETGLSGKRINCHIKTQQFLRPMKIDPEDFYRTATIIKLKDFIKENKKKRVQLEMIEHRKMLFTYLFTGSLSEPKRANERK